MHCGWDGSLNFFLDSLLLVYRNTTVFCMLILYPATLLNSSVLKVFFFFGRIFRVYIYRVVTSANIGKFTSLDLETEHKTLL